MIKGFDLSNWQPAAVDFGAARRNTFEWVYIKASEGTGTDPSYAEHRDAALAAGLVVGAYHFCRPGYVSAAAECDHFISVAGFRAGMFAVVDIEAGAGNLAGYLQDFVQHFHDRLGFWPLVYSGEWFSGPHGLDNSVVTRECGLIQSGYVGSLAQLPAAPGWNRVGWQFTNRQTIYAGLECDGDWWLYDLATLQKYAMPGGAPVPVPTPPPDPDRVYVVRAGDTMSAIAERFGLSLAALEADNRQIPNPSLIYPGQVVTIPGVGAPPASAPPHMYVVRAGDTMSEIAQRFGVGLAALEEANDQISNPNLIFPGQVLTIP